MLNLPNPFKSKEPNPAQTETTTTPETQSEPTTTINPDLPNQDTQSTTDDGLGTAHFDDISVDGEELGGMPGETPAKASDIIDADTFYQNFKGCFDMASLGLGVTNLAIHPHEADRARAASDAMYEIACETPFLNFLVAPEGVWAKRIMVIAAFGYPKYMAVRVELMVKKDQKQRDQQTPGMAADDTSDMSAGEKALSGLPKAGK